LWIHSHRYYSGAWVPAQPVATTGTGGRTILRGIDRRGDELHDAFVSTGLDIPEDLQDVPRTIFADPGRPELDKFYDQIAWFTGAVGLPALSLRYSRGGFFDFAKATLTARKLAKAQPSWRISDHYRLRAEFSLRD
jgi:hypothetical protein